MSGCPIETQYLLNRKRKINHWNIDFLFVWFCFAFYSIHDHRRTTSINGNEIRQNPAGTFCQILFSVKLKLKKTKKTRTITSVQLACLRSRNDASRNHNKNGLYAKDHWLAEPAHHAVEKRGLAENLTPTSRQMKSVNLKNARVRWEG